MSSPDHSTQSDHRGRFQSAGRASLRVRLAAVVTLIAMITLGASVVSVVPAHLGDLNVAFVCVLVFACRGWLALTRHGLGRLLGLAAALFGLIGVLRRSGVDGLLLTPEVAGATASLESNGGHE